MSTILASVLSWGLNRNRREIQKCWWDCMILKASIQWKKLSLIQKTPHRVGENTWTLYIWQVVNIKLWKNSYNWTRKGITHEKMGKRSEYTLVQKWHKKRWSRGIWKSVLHNLLGNADETIMRYRLTPLRLIHIKKFRKSKYTHFGIKNSLVS